MQGKSVLTVPVDGLFFHSLPTWANLSGNFSSVVPSVLGHSAVN